MSSSVLSDGTNVAVVIATTTGPVRVTDCFLDPDMTIASEMRVRDGLPTRVNRSEHYNQFVKDVYAALRRHLDRPHADINMELQVDADIEAGQSWQLGALVCQVLCLDEKTITEPANSQRIYWCTGRFGHSSGTINAVDFVRQKLENSLGLFEACEQPTEILIPKSNGADAEGLVLPAHVSVREVETIQDVVRVLGTHNATVEKTNPVTPNPEPTPSTRNKSRLWPWAAAAALTLIVIAGLVETAPWQNGPKPEGEGEGNGAVAGPSEPETPRLANMSIVGQRAPDHSNCIAVTTDFGDAIEPELETLVSNPSGALEPENAAKNLCGLVFTLAPAEPDQQTFALLAIRHDSANAILEPSTFELEGTMPVKGEATRALTFRPRGDVAYDAALITGTKSIPRNFEDFEQSSDWTALLEGLEAEGFLVDRFSQEFLRR